MHEMSIAEAIWDLAQRHLPSGTILRGVSVRAGPMRGIDPQCMELAWRGVRQGDAALRLNILDWRMECADCGRRWEQPEFAGQCACGSSQVRPIGGDELQLISIEVDDVETERSRSCTCRLSKMS